MKQLILQNSEIYHGFLTKNFVKDITFKLTIWFDNITLNIKRSSTYNI